MAEQTLPQPQDLPKAPGRKIIRAGEVNAWIDGYRFLAETQDAHAAERAKGYAEGMAAAQESAGRLVTETAAKVDLYLASLEQDVARLAFDIARRVFSEFDARDLVARAAQNALADLREAKSVRLRIHPNAEPRVAAMLAARPQPTSPAVVVQTDQDLDETACILSTEFAIIEATVETQLAAIAEAMRINIDKPQR